MSSLAKTTSRTLRAFRVGIIGSSTEEMKTIIRIFSATQFRTRRYEAVALSLTSTQIPSDIDIVIVSQTENTNYTVEQSLLSKLGLSRPMVQMLRNVSSDTKISGYAIRTPLNPARFLKMLDQYTIRELNYFPEFEIGHDGEIKSEALAGLRMLKNANVLSGKKQSQSLSRALVIDDSLAVRSQMAIEFDLINHEVDLVDSAESAMLAVSRNRYSIIFLDVVMPGMDGYTACKKIKRSVLNRNTPIIMLTSRSSSFDKFKGTLAGCAAYLIKPINHNEFEQIFKSYARENTSLLNTPMSNTSPLKNAHSSSARLNNTPINAPLKNTRINNGENINGRK